MVGIPLSRGQGNERFRTADAKQGAKRGQTVPYDVNGAPTGGDSDTLEGQPGSHYLDRGNHTGSQLAATISDLTEAVQDILGTAIASGANISVTYDDPAGTFTIAVTGLASGNISDFAEAAQDAVGGLLTDTATIDFTYDDAAGTITGDLKDNAVTNGKLRDSAALSVIGRSANSTGDPADIAAGSDHQVLRRSGTTLGFGAVALNQAAAVTGTLPVANGGTGAATFTNNRVLTGNGTGAIVDESGLTYDGSTLTVTGKGTFTAGVEASGYVTPALSHSVLFQSDTSIGYITAWSGGATSVLRLTGSSISFYGGGGATLLGTWDTSGLTSAGWMKTASYTVATLPAAAAAGAGARAYVSDANATTFASVVAGGGANKVPVSSDGASWRIG